MSDLPNTVTIESLNELIEESAVTYSNPIGTLTHCVITLPCGFTVTGESACVDPKKYDKAEGEKWALEKAKSSLWMLEGYLLSNDRYRAEQKKSEPCNDECVAPCEHNNITVGGSYEDNASCSECKRSYLS